MRGSEHYRRLIGGSQVPAILGCDPYRTAHTMWLEMMGHIARREPTIEMLIGKALERQLAECVYPLLAKREASWVNQTYHHSDIPCLIATPDALSVDGQRVVEIKTASYHARRQWEYGPPQHVGAQGQYYMRFLGLPYCDVFALVAGEPLLFELEHDPQLSQAIFDIVTEWHKRCIVKGEEPPLDGSEETRRWLDEQHRKYEPARLREPTPEEASLLQDYEDLRITQGHLQDEREIIENQLRRIIGDHEGLAWDTGRITWKQVKGATTTDWEVLAESLLEKFLPKDEHKQWRTEFSITKPGYRRLLFKSDAFTQSKQPLEVEANG